MTDSLTDNQCLESITHSGSCCEGARRPAVPFNERKAVRIVETLGETCCEPHRIVNPIVDVEKAVRSVSADPITRIIQERGAVYGPAKVNLDCVARHWQAYLDNREPGPLTAVDVCHLNMLQKISRLARTPTHQDSRDDIKGFAGLAEEVQ